MKELRLALVCYGGSSLAIYMHGVTKEVHRLVKGSALFDAGIQPGPTALSESVYFDVLAELAERQSVRTRVVVDVIAGTSAGGINGIYLAKSLTHNRSQDLLRDLWFKRGDMKQLLLLPTRWPWKLRLALLLPRAFRRSPLRGADMARWLYEALEGMDDGGSEPDGLATLLPEGAELDLFVTMTDFFGYDRQVQIADPLLVHDQQHRHAMEFRFGPGQDHFRQSDNGSLAFAARATSCFPGVFPPVSFTAFQEWVPEAQLGELQERFFRIYTLSGADPASTQFIDGGVLDNKPFGWAIGAIADRRADFEVDRRLLYLEPDPGERFLTAPGEPPAPKPAPSTVAALMGAAGGIPRHEPILDDLLSVGDHNERVAKIRDVIETSFPGVADFVVGVIGSPDTLPDNPDSEQLASWRDQINNRTIAEAGLSYATYLRVKISGVVDRYAQTICDVCNYPADSNHAQLVRTVIREWADEAGLFKQEPQPTAEQLALLTQLDLDFGQRQLRFVIAALRWWYRDLQSGAPNTPPRAELDQAKQILYDAGEKLRATMGGDAFDDSLRERIATCFPEHAVQDFLQTKGLDPAGYLAQHRADLQAADEQLRAFVTQQLHGFKSDLYRDLNAVTSKWHPDRRRDLLVRYLGFPLWDVLLYPLQAFADAGENDTVTVQRLSPYEATVLRTPPADKVQGKRLMHFWAFFERNVRENDYLWGRLDGAAHLLGILLGKDNPEYRSACLKAFAAILDEEKQALTHIPTTVQALRAEIALG
jgi:patatin-related protein